MKRKEFNVFVKDNKLVLGCQERNIVIMYCEIGETCPIDCSFKRDKR